jgi:Holliday junction resolvasome RuvABC endonuclease subunit
MIVGFDPSWKKLGYGVVDEEGLPVTAGSVLLTRKDGGWLHQQCKSAMIEVKLDYAKHLGLHPPKFIGMEDPTARSMSNAKKYGSVMSMIELAWFEIWGDIPNRLWLPAQWKREVGLAGNVKKDVYSANAKEFFPDIDETDDDACAGLLIAKATWIWWNNSETD